MPTIAMRNALVLVVVVVLVVLVLLVAAPPPLAAPAAAAAEAPSAGVEEQLAAIRQELRRLVALAEEQAAARRLGLALQRLELEERAMAGLVTELGALRAARHALFEARFAAQDGLEQLVADARSEAAAPPAAEAQALGRRIRDLERRVQQLDDELIATERRIEELEGEVPGRRAALRSLRARVDQQLGGP